MRRTLVALLVGLTLAPAAVAATKSPVFGLRAGGNPKLGYFVYTIAPGSSRSGTIIVSNTGNAAGTVKLFTADGATGHTTGTVYLTDKAPTKAGSWVKLAQSSVTLAPGASRTVPFTVRVPSGTPAGEWVGGIVAETARRVTGPKSKSKASVQIRVRDLTIVAVQSNVPGPRTVAFSIGAVKAGGQRGFQQLIAHLSNTGNALAKPTGSATVFDASGGVVEKLPFRMDTFLPQTSIDYPILLKKALAAGTYRVAVALDAGGTRFAAKPQLTISQTDVKQVFTSAAPSSLPAGSAASSSGSGFPWPLVLLVVAAAVLVGLLLWLLRSRRRGTRIPPTTVQRSPSAQLADALAASREREPEQAIPPVPAEPSIPEAPPAPAERPPAPPAVPEPIPVARPEACIPYHFWEVAYDRGQLGGDGVWRFPHRCRNCGLELLAADVADATAQADRS